MGTGTDSGAAAASLAAPSSLGEAGQRPLSMVSSTSSGSSNNNQFYDDMTYLDQVVEQPKKAAKSSKIKWSARRPKAESMNNSSGATKAMASTMAAKVRPQGSMANLPRTPSHPPKLQPYPSATESTPSLARPPSSVGSVSTYSTVTAPPPPPPPMVTLSSDSELDGPSLFDDLASLDTATVSSKATAKTKAQAKGKKAKEPRKPGNSGFGKFKLLKSSSSSGRASSRSSETASTVTARASMSLSGSSGSSFTFPRSRSRSSFSSRSTATMTSLTTITNSAHSEGSDPSAHSSKSSNPNPANAHTSSPPTQSFPTVESTAPQLRLPRFSLFTDPNATSGASTSAPSSSTTPSTDVPSSANTQTSRRPSAPYLAEGPPPLLTSPRAAPAPPLSTSPQETAALFTTAPRRAPEPPIPISPRMAPRPPSPFSSSPRQAPAPPLSTSPRRAPVPPISTSPSSIPSYPSSSPPPFASYHPTTSPTAAYNATTSPTAQAKGRQRASSSGHGQGNRYSYNSWQHDDIPSRRTSISQARKGSVSTAGGRKDSASSLIPPSVEYSRRPSRGSVAEPACLSIIDNFPSPPDMQMDGSRLLGPGIADRLASSLAAVTETDYHRRFNFDSSPQQANVASREQSAVFSDEYMNYVSTPSPPNLDALRMGSDGRSARTSPIMSPRRRGSNDVAQEAAHETEDQQPSLTSECTEASTSPTILTPDVAALSTLSVPWAKSGSSMKRVNSNHSANSLNAETGEAARPESVMLPDSLSSTAEHSPVNSPMESSQNHMRFADADYDSADQVDPLAHAPALPKKKTKAPSYPPPPPIPADYFKPSFESQTEVEWRRTSGPLPSLPDMPVVPERSPARTDRISSSTSSTFSIMSSLSPTLASFPGVPETAPLALRGREHSGGGRSRVVNGIAPLNIAARSRTTSTASSVESSSSYAQPSGGQYSSSSHGSSYESARFYGPQGGVGMIASMDTPPRYNMSGHNVTRYRTNSSGHGSKRLGHSPGLQVPPPRPRRRSATSSLSNSASSTPPSSTPHTPNIGGPGSYGPSSFNAPPVPALSYRSQPPAPLYTSQPIPVTPSRPNGQGNSNGLAHSGSITSSGHGYSHAHNGSAQASGYGYSGRAPVSPRRTPASPPRVSPPLPTWEPSSPRSRGVPF